MQKRGVKGKGPRKETFVQVFSGMGPLRSGEACKRIGSIEGSPITQSGQHRLLTLWQSYRFIDSVEGRWHVTDIGKAILNDVQPTFSTWLNDESN